MTAAINAFPPSPSAKLVRDVLVNPRLSNEEATLAREALQVMPEGIEAVHELAITFSTTRDALMLAVLRYTYQEHFGDWPLTA